MSKNEFKPLSRKANIVTQETGNEILIYDLKINKAFILNETSSIIWLACDGNKTVSQISKQISKQFNSPINEEFVWFALEQLKNDNLIENEFFAPFEGLSRREIIRKVGFASIVALPVIASLVAPMAINAQSGCSAANKPNGCSCTSNASCASGACGRNAGVDTCTVFHGDPPGADCRSQAECASNSCTGSPLKCA